MNTRAVLPLVALVSVVVWVAAGELQWPARAITTLLLVPLPAAMVLQNRLLGNPSELPRLPIYGSSAAAQMVLAALTLGAGLTSGFQPHALGLAVPGGWFAQLAWAAATVLVALAITWGGHLLGVRESPLLLHLLPRTTGERAAFVALSITAGSCEELVFRGFLIVSLQAASGSLVLALLVSSLAFGVVHAYQQPAGVARATLLGLVLATPFVSTGSLVGAMLAHTLVDVIGGFWLGPKFLRSDR